MQLFARSRCTIIGFNWRGCCKIQYRVKAGHSQVSILCSSGKLHVSLFISVQVTLSFVKPLHASAGCSASSCLVPIAVPHNTLAAQYQQTQATNTNLFVFFFLENPTAVGSIPRIHKHCLQTMGAQCKWALRKGFTLQPPFLHLSHSPVETESGTNSQ